VLEAFLGTDDLRGSDDLTNFSASVSDGNDLSEKTCQFALGEKTSLALFASASMNTLTYRPFEAFDLFETLIPAVIYSWCLSYTN